MKYEEMSDFEINLAAAKARYHQVEFIAEKEWVAVIGSGYRFDPCNDPSDAWPIIVDNRISIHHDIARYSADSLVYSKRFDDGFKIFRHEGKMGDTSSRAALRAAMICFLKMKDAENE